MKNRQGFTIVDVLLTVIILGILASVIIPKFQGAQSRARQTAREELLNIYNRASLRFQTDTDLFAATLDDLAAEKAPKNGLSVGGTLVSLRAAHWHGPYVSDVQKDPVTGRSFTYHASGKLIGTITIPADVVESGDGEVGGDLGTGDGKSGVTVEGLD